MKFYKNNQCKEYNRRHSIDFRLNRAIRKGNDSNDIRYYLFRKVLSSSTVQNCLKAIPADNHLSSIQTGGRLFDANPVSKKSQELQKIFRGSNIYFRQRAPSKKTLLGSQQEMKIPEFYLAVASKLEVTNAQLGLTDRLIVHEPRLQVFPCFFFLISD